MHSLSELNTEPRARGPGTRTEDRSPEPPSFTIPRDLQQFQSRMREQRDLNSTGLGQTFSSRTSHWKQNSVWARCQGGHGWGVTGFTSLQHLRLKSWLELLPLWKIYEINWSPYNQALSQRTSNQTMTILWLDDINRLYLDMLGTWNLELKYRNIFPAKFGLLL